MGCDGYFEYENEKPVVSLYCYTCGLEVDGTEDHTACEHSSEGFLKVCLEIEGYHER